MKLFCTALLIGGCSLAAQAQLNVAYHQSNLPFVGLSYDFGRFHPELRVGTDAFTSDLNPELTLNYKFVNQQDFYVYAGVGGRTNTLSGGVVPLGIVAFPFASRRVGFHTEVALLGLGDYGTVLRGSWGIKFNLGNAEKKAASPVQP
ncbi:hypothetical protein CDA63_07430 [Hymenobacter amundsenii]|uniref:Outer membrane protein beta-barrel domain-containing protein n=1 Tax=Hymenobacter amundsenii TaxID=2006685 RepID=A0A246FM87_9BACT|nr:hypothetical protein [Hymenobacter amundsenii]OWP63809.1 hypothetical protein CDA63_07430 [Hymenobacter amundsenii]